MRGLILATSIAATPYSAAAQAVLSAEGIAGLGAQGCETVVGVENAPVLAGATDWALGYLAGRRDAGHREVPDEPLSTTDPADVAVSILLYCRENPGGLVLDALRDYGLRVFAEGPQADPANRPRLPSRRPSARPDPGAPVGAPSPAPAEPAPAPAPAPAVVAGPPVRPTPPPAETAPVQTAPGETTPPVVAAATSAAKPPAGEPPRVVSRGPRAPDTVGRRVMVVGPSRAADGAPPPSQAASASTPVEPLPSRPLEVALEDEAGRALTTVELIRARRLAIARARARARGVVLEPLAPAASLLPRYRPTGPSS